ncbi:MAG TPA: hypothetical protein VFH16_02795 [Rubrobacter sp.]|nr:hypothetical protein [Rubrobacter sp.]
MRVVHVELAWFSALAEGEQCPAPLANTLALAIPALATKRQHIADDEPGAQEGIAEAPASHKRPVRKSQGKWEQREDQNEKAIAD